jgi:hypothetical protein
MIRWSVNKLIMTSLVVFMMGSFEGRAQKPTPRPAYGPGEELHYVMSYGFINGGRGILSVRDSVIRGKKCTTWWELPIPLV